jgi:yecA family protein
VTAPSYEIVQEVLGPAAGAGEAHGTLVGLLSAAVDDLPGSWIVNTFADATEDTGFPSAADQEVLTALYEDTRAALSGDEMAFALLLPDDEEVLGDRVTALGGWCQGYLYGLAVRGLKDFGELPDDVREILGDLAQIAQAGPDDDDDEESGEQAYVELVEYVRVGVQWVYDQLAPPVKTNN